MANITSGRGMWFLSSDPVLPSTSGVTADPTVCPAGAASAGTKPVFVRWISVAPLATGAAASAQGKVELRDGTSVLGTWGVLKQGVSASFVCDTTVIPVNLAHTYATGMNVLWTAGTNSASASVNVSWGVGEGP